MITDIPCFCCKGKGGGFFEGDSFSHRRANFPPCHSCGRVTWGFCGEVLSRLITVFWVVGFVAALCLILWALASAQLYEDCRDSKTKEQCEELL